MFILLKKLLFTTLILIVVGAMSYGVMTLSKQEKQANISFKNNKKAIDSSHNKVSEDVQIVIDAEVRRLESEKVKLAELRKQYSFYGEADTELTDHIITLGDEIIKESKDLTMKVDKVTEAKKKVTEIIDKLKLYREVEDGDKKAIHDYVEELKNWSQNVTPTNSGLTQTQINQEKSVINSLEKEVNKTMQEIVKYEEILKQEEVIKTVVENIEEIRSSGTDTNTIPTQNTTDSSVNAPATTQNQTEFPGYSYESSVYTDDAPKNGLVPVIFFTNKKSTNTNSPDILQGSDL